MMTRLNFVALLLALSSVAACSASTSDAGSSESNETSQARALGIVKGREYAKCWFDLVGESAQLSCTSTARGGDPLKNVTVDVVVAGSNGFRKSLDIEAGGTAVVVGSVPANSFPRNVQLQVALDWDAKGALGLDSGWSHAIDVPSMTAMSSASPIVIGQPFDFWEIGISFALTHGGGYSFRAEPYSQPSAPYRLGLEGRDTFAFEPELGRFGKVSYIAAPKAGGAIPVHQSFHPMDSTTETKTETSLPGPGYWTIADDGIRAATPEEITKDFGAPPAPNGPGTTQPSQPAPNEPGTTDPEPNEPPGPVDADPSCGGNGQSLCVKAGTSSCDAGTRNDNGKCVSCGADGQPLCYLDPNGVSSFQGSKCNAGTRNDNGKCVSCGADGQPLCYLDPNGVSSVQGAKCNAGTRNDNGKCISCGADGQPVCYADPNGITSFQGIKCNDGLRNQNGTCRP